MVISPFYYMQSRHCISEFSLPSIFPPLGNSPEYYVILAYDEEITFIILQPKILKIFVKTQQVSFVIL